MGKISMTGNRVSGQFSDNAGRESASEAIAATECFLCQYKGRLLYSDIVDRLYYVKGKWSLIQCAECGLVWLHPKPLPEEIDSFYKSYFTHECADGTPWFTRTAGRGVPAVSMGYRDSVLTPGELMWGRIFSLIGPVRMVGERSVMWLPAERRGKLLDVGCGTGAFLAHMHRLGWDVSGVESDPKAAMTARSVLKSDDIHMGQVEDIAFEKESFDAVTMGHVIEHLLDPMKTLRSCYRILKPGGLLVIVTPNSASLGRRRFKELWRGWEPPRHIHIFNTKSLARMAVKAGYRVRTIMTPSGGTYAIWLLTLINKEKTLHPGRDVPAPTLMMRIQSAFFWVLEDALSRLGMECGEEVLLIAERPG